MEHKAAMKEKCEKYTWAEHSFNTAVRTERAIKDCQEEIQSGAQAQALKGIGPKTGKNIDKWVGEIRKSTPAELQRKFERYGGTYENFKEQTKRKSKKRKKEEAEGVRVGQPPKKKKKKSEAPRKKKKPYRPKHCNGPWALLVGLRNTQRGKHFTKKEVISMCQRHCKSSFTDPIRKTFGGGGGYTAWSSVTTLQSKGLITVLRSKVQIHFITEKGRALAEELVLEAMESGKGLLPGEDVENISRESSDVISDEIFSASRDIGFSSDYVPPRIERKLTPPKIKKPYVRGPGQWDIVEDFGLPPPGKPMPKLPKHYEGAPKRRQDYSQAQPSPPLYVAPRPPQIQIQRITRSDLFLGWSQKLICDHQERRVSPNKDDIVKILDRELGVPVEKRSLGVGDYLFVMEKPGHERFVLPMIIERKEGTDLRQSIIDGRFEDQKYRLKRTELKYLAYLVEGDMKQSAGYGKQCVSEGALDFSMHQCSSEGFMVFRTKSPRDTAQMLRNIFISLRDHIRKHIQQEEFHLLQFANYNYFKEFEKLYTRKKESWAQVASTRFGQMLMVIPRVNHTTAQKIIDRYPSLQKLMEALLSSKDGEAFLKKQKLARDLTSSKNIFRALTCRNYNDG